MGKKEDWSDNVALGGCRASPTADLRQCSWHCNHLRGFQKMAPNRETIQRAAAVWRTNGWLLLSGVRMVQTGWRTLEGNGKSNNHWFHPTLQRLQSWSSGYALNSYFVKGAVYLIKRPVDVPVIIQSQNHKKKQKTTHLIKGDLITACSAFQSH